MLEFILLPVIIFYLLVIGVLTAYSINYLYLTILALRKTREMAPASKLELDEWPSVAVQLPVYNELYVAERIIRAAAAFDYPADKFSIQVLDDSTDETSQIAAEVVAELQQQGVNISHLHRSNRDGFKAGALQAGLMQTQAEFIAIFDADFVPEPDFLKKSVAPF